MKILVDTNIVLDVLLRRSPFYQNSFTIFQLVDKGLVNACLSAVSMTNIMMDELTALFTVVPVSETTIANALALRWKDFEDAVQYINADENGAEYIVTRNTQGYTSGHIPAITPEHFIQFITEIQQ